MNQDDLRVALTVLSFIVFIGIVVWAYSRRRRRDFDEAANAPFTGREFGPDDASAGHEESRR